MMKAPLALPCRMVAWVGGIFPTARVSSRYEPAAITRSHIHRAAALFHDSLRIHAHAIRARYE